MTTKLQSLRLFPFTAPDPRTYPLLADSTVLCFFFSEADVDQLNSLSSKMYDQLRPYCDTSVLVFAVFDGKDPTCYEIAGWRDERVKNWVFWTGPKREVSVDLGVTAVPSLVVLSGGAVTQRLPAIPEDLMTLLPPHPTYPQFTYATFYEYLLAHDNLPILNTYTHYNQCFPRISNNEANVLLYSISSAVGLSLHSDAFESNDQLWDLGNSILALENIDKDSFVRRFQSYCKLMVQKTVGMDTEPRGGSLPLYSLSDGAVVKTELKPQTVSFCYFFTEKDVGSVGRLHEMVKEQVGAYCEYPLNVFYVYVGKDTSAVELTPLKTHDFGLSVFWAGPAGLQSDEWKEFDVSETPSFLVFNGVDVPIRQSTYPPDLTQFLLPTYQTNFYYNFPGLVEHIQNKDNDKKQVQWVYNRVKQTYGNVSVVRVKEISEKLGIHFKVDMSTLSEWFVEKNYWRDAENRIDNLEDMDLSQFEKRLVSFCSFQYKLASTFFMQVFCLKDASNYTFVNPYGCFAFVYYFTDSQISTVPTFFEKIASQLAGYCSVQVLAMALYCGRDVEKPQLETLKQSKYAHLIYWTGPDGESSQVCLDAQIKEFPSFRAYSGMAITEKSKVCPENLVRLLPPRPTYPEFTYSSLMSYFGNNYHNHPVYFGHMRLAQLHPTMPYSVICTLISDLSREFHFDLTEVMWWAGFNQPYSDIVDPPVDVVEVYPEGMQATDLESHLYTFLNWKSSQGDKPPNYRETKVILRKLTRGLQTFKDIIGLGSDAEVALQQAQSELSQKNAELATKEDEIEQLKRELAERNTELTQLKEEPAVPSKPKSYLSLPADMETAPVMKSVDVGKSLREKDDFDFWKHGQEEDWEAVHIQPQRFEEIAAAKGLWIVTAEHKGLMSDVPQVTEKFLHRPAPRGRNKQSLPPLSEPPRPQYAPQSKEPRKPVMPSPKPPPTKAVMAASGSSKQLAGGKNHKKTESFNRKGGSM